jgi:ElaB/YqjD/DUF883 family membrane-anchored ribosome-binding protein
MTDDLNGITQSAREKLDAAKTKAQQGAAAARERVNSAYSTTRETVAGAYGSAREKADRAYATSRARTEAAARAARQKASAASRATADGVDNSPIAVLMGGLALGALAGALLPRTEREVRTIGPIGRRVNKTASEAVQAAKAAGARELKALGLDKEHAQAQVSTLVDKAMTAASTAGNAAARSVTKGKATRRTRATTTGTRRTGTSTARKPGPKTS